MDTTDPNISFNAQGICNHCIEFQSKEYQRKLDKTELPWVIYEIQKSGKKSKYDCLLGVSGGVDSSLCLHYLVENGLRPLCFSIDNGWNTTESDENIMRMVESLKVPFYRYTIDLKKFRELQTAFIKSGTINIEIPTDHILMAASYEMARKYNIKYIISGGNLATEGIMPKAWGYQARDLKFIKSVFKKAYLKKISGLPFMSLAGYLYNRFLKGIQVINLLDYYEYKREDAKKLLNKKYGWKDYGDKHCESKFTKWFQNYYLPVKFGIDKRKAHYSSEINSGQMSRQQAIELLKQPMDSDWPWPEVKDMMDYPVKSYKDYLNSEKAWNLLSQMRILLHR